MTGEFLGPAPVSQIEDKQDQAESREATSDCR